MLTFLVRLFYPCYRQEHTWGPGLSVVPTGVSTHLFKGERCGRCRQFRNGVPVYFETHAIEVRRRYAGPAKKFC